MTERSRRSRAAKHAAYAQKSGARVARRLHSSRQSASCDAPYLAATHAPQFSVLVVTTDVLDLYGFQGARIEWWGARKW